MIWVMEFCFRLGLSERSCFANLVVTIETLACSLLLMQR